MHISYVKMTSPNTRSSLSLRDTAIGISIKNVSKEISVTQQAYKRTLSPWQLYESKGNLVSKIKGQRE
jgi:hypothetical protein